MSKNKRIWINTKIVWQWDEKAKRLVEIKKEGYWWDGPVSYLMGDPNLVQTSFAAFNDDGSLTTATQIGSNNANWTQDTDTTFRVRFEISETAGNAANNNQYVLYYSTTSSAGPYSPVLTGSAVQVTASANVADGTALATADSHFGNQDVDGEFDSNASTGNISLNNEQTEMEYCLTIDSAQVTEGTLIYLRVYISGGTALNSYTNTPQITANVPPKTASGNPTLNEVVSTGTANIFLKANGTPTLDELTSTGVARLAPKVWLNSTQTLSGATQMTVTAFNDAGTEITFTDPSGAPTGSLFLGVENMQAGGGEANTGWIAVTVNVAGNKTASGTPALNELTSTGTARIKLKADGTPTLAEATSTGTAVLKKGASGTPTLNELTSTGTARKPYQASGSPTLDELTATGQAGKKLVASGSPALDELTSTGTATAAELLTASGNPTLDELTSTGTAVLKKGAFGTPTLAELTASGKAGLKLQASGSPILDELTSTGSASQILTASGTPTLDELTSTGTATKSGDKPASGTPVLNELTSTGTAELFKGASGSPTLAELTSVGTAAIKAKLTASGNPTLSELTSTGTAVSGENRPASGNPTLDELTSSGTAKLLKGASGSPTLAELTASGTAGLKLQASGSPTLDEVTAAGTARIFLKASGSPTLAELTASGTAEIPVVVTGGDYNAAEQFPTGSTVTITLYDPLTSLTVPLSSASCVEIPGTGLFVWASDKLATQPVGYKEYVWLMTDSVTEKGGVIRVNAMGVEDLMNYEMENGETFSDQMLLIRADAAGDIVQQEDGTYVIKSADGVKDRIVGEPTANGGRDITATNTQVGSGFDSGFDEGFS